MKFFIKDSCGFPQFPVDSVIFTWKTLFLLLKFINKKTFKDGNTKKYGSKKRFDDIFM